MKNIGASEYRGVRSALAAARRLEFREARDFLMRVLVGATAKSRKSSRQMPEHLGSNGGRSELAVPNTERSRNLEATSAQGQTQEIREQR